MKRKTRRKIKNGFLYLITGISWTVFLLSMFCMDSESPVPMIALFASMAWISYFDWCNGWGC